jgi:hypothetical protein
MQFQWKRNSVAPDNVRDACSFKRSIRRGTPQTRDQWRAQEAAKGGRAATFGNNMTERYMDVKAAIESLLPEAL